MILLQKYNGEYKQIYVNFKVCQKDIVKELILKWKKTDTVMWEILFLAFKDETSWIWFFSKSES